VPSTFQQLASRFSQINRAWNRRVASWNVWRSVGWGPAGGPGEKCQGSTCRGCLAADAGDARLDRVLGLPQVPWPFRRVRRTPGVRRQLELRKAVTGARLGDETGMAAHDLGGHSHHNRSTSIMRRLVPQPARGWEL